MWGWGEISTDATTNTKNHTTHVGRETRNFLLLVGSTNLIREFVIVLWKNHVCKET
jgi:hypothetical protein